MGGCQEPNCAKHYQCPPGSTLVRSWNQEQQLGINFNYYYASLPSAINTHHGRTWWGHVLIECLSKSVLHSIYALRNVSLSLASSHSVYNVKITLLMPESLTLVMTEKKNWSLPNVLLNPDNRNKSISLEINSETCTIIRFLKNHST